MFGKWGRSSALAIGAVLLTGGLTNAQENDTFRLGRIPAASDEATQRLDLRADNDADTMTVAHGGGRGGSFHGGFARGGSFHGGYRSYGFYRPSVSIGIGLGYGYGYGYYGYRPYYRPYYYPSIYYYSPYYYSPYYSYGDYYGMSGASYSVPPQIIQVQATQPRVIQPIQIMPRIDDNSVLPSPRLQQPMQAAPNGPFQYDGGPVTPVPMPNKEVAPSTPKERFVSIPATKKYSYAAYGEKPGLKTGDESKSLIVKTVNP